MVISSVYDSEQGSICRLKKLLSHPDLWQDKSIITVCS